MEQTLEHRIRQRAYEIWHAHGQADGQADEHWLTAEREVLSTLRTHPACETAAAQKPQKRTRASSRAGAQRSAKASTTPAVSRAKS